MSTKVYPAVIMDFDISDYRPWAPTEPPKHLVIHVFDNAEYPEEYVECFLKLKRVCSEREPCAHLYKIFREAESWGDVMGETIGVTLSRDSKIQKIVRVPDTITEEKLIARNAERRRIKEQYQKTGAAGLTRREYLIALSNVE